VSSPVTGRISSVRRKRTIRSLIAKSSINSWAKDSSISPA
jgi:hypothetical protein